MNQVQLSEVTKELAAAAQGRIPADTVIRNATLVNVNTGELLPSTDIAIVRGRIALVGDAGHTIGAETVVYDATGYFIAPGFMDGHIHVESSMMPVRGYAQAVVPHGTTAIFADPHEIANIFGVKGIEFMMKDSRSTPLRFYVALPSCVPAMPFFEDTGAEITPEDIAGLIGNEMVCGLGEMMNFPGVLAGDEKVHEELRLTLAGNKTVTGHYSVQESGKGLNAYIAAGVRCDHETTRKEDAIEKMRRGMYVQIREGSAWHDLAEVVRSITETKIDTRYACLVSDDAHPHTLITDGHLDHIVRRAIEEGVDPVNAIQMVTINTAQCFGMDRDYGSVAPGRIADLVWIGDLKQVDIHKVFINGELVAEDGKLCNEPEATEYPDWVMHSMNLRSALTPMDFAVAAPDWAAERVLTKVIEVIEAKVGTYERRLWLPVVPGTGEAGTAAQVTADLSQDVCKVSVIERHKKTGRMATGFVKGFGLNTGAVASTVAHDAHNLLVVGTNDADMALAADVLAKAGGGMTAVRDGEVLAVLALPIAGLMSADGAETIAAGVAALDNKWKELGCDMVSPFMTMALLSLAVLPELRLTNRGLVDTVTFEFTEMFVKE